MKDTVEIPFQLYPDSRNVFVKNTPSLATKGGTASARQEVSLSDLQIRYQLSEGKEWLYLTSGFFRPQLGRESITSAWSVNSFEKAISQSYVRSYLVNAGHGRAPRFNLGGITTLKTG